ncbi:hypothetical protein AMK21_23460 [Streptomyces sp. CB00316]|nr:hypothetical protein AMK21_23460 [Streptomyces sp. CB00316]
METGGEAGVAVHLALAYGLGARHPEDRISAVDALLVLAAQGRLDTALLGRELGALVDHDLVKARTSFFSRRKRTEPDTSARSPVDSSPRASSRASTSWAWEATTEMPSAAMPIQSRRWALSSSSVMLAGHTPFGQLRPVEHALLGERAERGRPDRPGDRGSTTD